MTVFVRFAPSPTGLLHIGNIRPALFNYLFARKNGGRFMLRMDDTDKERSTDAFEQAIIRDLKWLGLEWDCYARQSDRLHRYTEELEKLKQSGRVYPCFETQAELDLKRKTQLGRGLPPVYDRGSLKLSEEDKEKLIAQGRKPHWRFRLDHKDVVWDDLIQKHKSFPAASLSDPVLIREDGVPLYTFCSIVDDVDFGVTHIIRGEDHVTNTAVQIQIWEAITDKPAPQFAHFPLLVSATGVEMSKRLGTLSIASMRDETKIEPMAISALLSSLGTSEAIAPHLTMDELMQTFSLDKISRATPKFDLEELAHLSAKILHIMPFEMAKTRLQALNLSGADDAVLERFWSVVRTNLTIFDDVQTWWTVAHDSHFRASVDLTDSADFLSTALDLLPSGAWDETTWGTWTQALKEKTGRKGKDLFMPLRLALTGVDHGPEMKSFLLLVGRDRVVCRLQSHVN